MKDSLKLCLIMALFSLCSSEILKSTDICECTSVISLQDCTNLAKCTWLYTTSRCVVNAEAPSQTPPISVLCSTLEKPAEECRVTIGCAYVEQVCVQFPGCTAYLKTSNLECQAISSSCTSDGKSCIELKSCDQYGVESECTQNTSSSGSHKCIWENNICRDQTCSEADKSLNTNEQCNNFISGCVTNGKGCTTELQLCSSYVPDCSNYIGTDGYCDVDPEDASKCSTMECSKAENTLITDLECSKFNLGCITTGRGCTKSPLENCSTYKGSTEECGQMIGSDGKCFGIDGLICQTRECINASTTINTDIECEQFKSGCLTTGKGCVSVRGLCSSYSGTADECVSYIGSDGYCVKGELDSTTSTTPSSCRAKVCSEAPSNYSSNNQCNAYQIGCITKGQGCVVSLQPCSTYQGNKTICSKLIGSDGICYGTSDTVTTACVLLKCTDAPTSLLSNLECNNFKKGCISSGSGCMEPNTCLNTIKQVSCQGSQGCLWNQICVTSSCPKLNSVSLCLNNLAMGKKCQWNNNACSTIPCTQAPITYTTNIECQQFQKDCVTNGAGCIDLSAPCTSYIGNTDTCAKFTGNSNSIKCYSPSATSVGPCKIKECTDNTTANSNFDCDLFLTGCLTKGIGCVPRNSECSAFVGNSQECLLFRALNLVQKCGRDQGSSGPCRNVICTDNLTSTTDVDCNSFLTGCKTKGTGCIAPTEPCTSYTGGSKDICQAFVGNNKQCWYTSGSNCVDRVCTQNITASNDETCIAFMSTCIYNGTAGCVPKTTECSFFNGTEAICNTYKGNGVKCTRKGPCSNKICGELTNPSSQEDCIKYSGSCRYNGSACIYATSCSLYTNVSSTICQSLTNANGGKCYLASGTGTCMDLACSHKSSANNQADCDQFLTGCIFTGTKCASKSLCSGYVDFTRDACIAAKDTNGNYCWKNDQGTGVCINKDCSNNVPSASLTNCKSHLSTCTFDGNICISLNLCSNYSLTESLCQTVKGTDGDCWNSGVGIGSCKVRSCSDVLTSTSIALCNAHKSTCRYTGTGCADVPSTCGGLSGTPEACQNLVLADTNKTKCWTSGTNPDACIPRLCSQVTSNCSEHMSTCVSNGTICVDKQNTCNLYSGFTTAACQAATDLNNMGCISGTGGACAIRNCTDTIPGPSDVNCRAYLSTCRYNGRVCIKQETSCTIYGSIQDYEFTQDACQIVTTTGDLSKCWKSNFDLGNCENRTCDNIINNPSVENCQAHLNGCLYNGSNCVTGQTNCGSYNLLYSLCQQVKTISGGLCWLATGTGSCQTRTCQHNTTATTDQACEAFLTGCVTNGQGCVSSNTSCDQFNGTSLSCLAFTGNSTKCKGGSSTTGTCSPMLCQDYTAGTTDASCNTYMSGCLTRGISGCIASTELCSSYSGTQQECSQFIGGGRKCWNISSAQSNTPCIQRNCTDNTTATSNYDCDSFLTGCKTNGKGCLTSTSPCTQYRGTYDQCNQFTGNSIKCSNVLTASTTTNCAARACTHNTTATSDLECELFLTGCITNGAGCVSVQKCSLFKGTKLQCSTYSASDKPCTGGSTVGASCWTLQCSYAPTAYTTDAECSQYKPGCVTNGMGCADSITCEEIVSSEGCSARSDCLSVGNCRQLQAICSTFDTPSLCLNTPVNTPTKRCAWNLTTKACADWTCNDASQALITHDACAAQYPTCTTKGTGCITMAPCSTYLTQSICSVAHSTDVGGNCVWENSSCRARQCEDAPKQFNTDPLCNGYLPNCRTNGYGCITPPYTCEKYLVRSKCKLDSELKPCLWFPLRTVKCANFAKCQEILKTTHSECQEYSTSCTTDGLTCVPISMCANYHTKISCSMGIDGVCGWLPNQTCQKFSSCQEAVGVDLTSCQGYGDRCVSDGTKCIDIGNCSSYSTEIACNNISKDGACVWDTTCRLRECKDATSTTATSLTTHEGCVAFQAKNKCTTNGTNCVDQQLCSSYTELTCFQGTDGKCIVKDNNCKLRTCPDIMGTSSSDCTTQMSTCVSNGTNCINKAQCSDYTTQIGCNSGGIDGVCVFSTSTNSCKLMSSCNDAGTDQVTCQKKSTACFWNGTTCSDQSCATRSEGGICLPFMSFDGASLTICVKNSSDQCVEGLGSYLGSSDCLALSHQAYSWNPVNLTCDKCNKNVDSGNTTNTNNDTNTNTNSTSTTEGNIIEIVSLLSLMMIMNY